MIRRSLALTLLVCLFVAANADARRRSVRVSGPPPDTSTPQAWLNAHAFALRSVELTSDSSDLAPLQSIVSDAAIVGLGDGTHGTHEFYTVKLRIIDRLVRELGFDVISFEAPSAPMNRIDAYVQGGAGDPRALLAATRQAGYYFWDTEEILAVMEWARAYNAHRGNQPAVVLAGADIYDAKGAAEEVLAYLRAVDPAAAGAAQSDYDCVLKSTNVLPFGCDRTRAAAVYDRLAARRAELGGAAYEVALQSARVVTQAFDPAKRDASMAINVQWQREHRSATQRMIFWAHSEHVGEAPTPQVIGSNAGMTLQQALGSKYVTIGTLSGAGQFRTADGVQTIPAMPDGAYETYFRLTPAPAALIPLRGAVPSWLQGPAKYFFAAAAWTPDNPFYTIALPEKFDAVVYVQQSTPIRPLSP